MFFLTNLYCTLFNHHPLHQIGPYTYITTLFLVFFNIYSTNVRTHICTYTYTYIHSFEHTCIHPIPIYSLFPIDLQLKMVWVAVSKDLIMLTLIINFFFKHFRKVVWNSNYSSFIERIVVVIGLFSCAYATIVRELPGSQANGDWANRENMQGRDRVRHDKFSFEFWNNRYFGMRRVYITFTYNNLASTCSISKFKPYAISVGVHRMQVAIIQVVYDNNDRCTVEPGSGSFGRLFFQNDLWRLRDL
jgi:hypothetical protein